MGLNNHVSPSAAEDKQIVLEIFGRMTAGYRVLIVIKDL